MRAFFHQTTLLLSINRLSNNIPKIFYDLSQNFNLEILNSNLFYCNNNHLPIQDPRSSSYSCGSLYLQNALITFIVILLIILFIIIINYIIILNNIKLFNFINNNNIIIMNRLFKYYANTSFQSLVSNEIPINISLFLDTLLLLFWISVIITFISLIILLPINLIVGSNHMNSKYTVQYGWIISMVLLHGNSIVILYSIIIFICLLLFRFIIRNFTTKIRKNYFSNIKTNEIIMPKQSYKSMIIMLLLQLINLIVTLIVNILFIITIDTYNFNYNILTIIQLTFSLFKVSWNIFFISSVYYLFTKKHIYSTSTSTSITTSITTSMMSTQIAIQHRLIMSLINFIIAPIIATLISNQSCFYYLFNQPNSINSSVIQKMLINIYNNFCCEKK